MKTTPDAIEYAKFTHHLLHAGLQTNIDQIQQAVSLYADKLSPEQNHLLKSGLFSAKYNKIPDAVRILMRAFSNVNSLASCLSQDHETIRKFIAAAKNEYDVFEPFNTTIIRMRHKSCGTTFFTTPSGFLTGWSCPSCSQKVESTKTGFKEQLKNLVGDEYTVIGEFHGHNTPVKIRHNKCGHTQMYAPKHFLNGSRCNYCVKIIPVERIPNIVSYVTDGQYKVKRTHYNLCEIEEEGGAVIEITMRRFLQEVFRPTPSDILPVPVKNIMHDWNNKLLENLPVRVSINEFYDQICSLYKPNQLIFIDDLKKQISAEQYSRLRSGIQRLVKSKKLYHVEKGIYSLTPCTLSPEELLREKYILRNGHRIGINDSKSLAYQMGMLKEKPSVTYIMTNCESVKHGRIKTVNGLPVHIRGNPFVINEDNYRYIQVLEMLKYTFHYDSSYSYVIPKFIKKHNLSLTVFLSLLPQYSNNVKKRFNEVWRVIDEQNN